MLLSDWSGFGTLVISSNGYYTTGKQMMALWRSIEGIVFAVLEYLSESGCGAAR